MYTYVAITLYTVYCRFKHYSFYPQLFYTQICFIFKGLVVEEK